MLPLTVTSLSGLSRKACLEQHGLDVTDFFGHGSSTNCPI
ncbi:hypothetical protein AM1_E0107 (plasmid) [Acaryochloris marina MBIC11017]|uniref:Uncharacterized protein n=1 Tax=Acaryochloris marina (strain MBIC 11017) TaxID=329726 RepID=A8ZPE0_ACAM1|nr:hypothetical protein AM1_E0107 [Acaryochloris marina MBIC11017]